jgi:hypothetical protein
MSDPIRNDLDPAAQVAGELRARLRAMAGDELVELCAQLLTTYVVEGVLPLARAGESSELAADTVGEESFAQLLKRLKASKKDPVLERFLIDGENISVRIDGQGVLPITEYRRPTGPPRAAGVSVVETPMPRRESVPGAASSIYNRSLYQEEQAPARPGQPPARTDAPRPAAAAQPSPQQAQQGQRPAQPGAQPAGAGKKEEPKSDRFSLIELE